MTEILDETDLQILRTLQRNAKLTTKELAEAVHLTPTPVFERQKRLERQGYIRKYVAVLNPEKLGLGLQVYCKVKLKQINHEIADSFTRRILRIPEVTECYNTSGAYDYLLKVRARHEAVSGVHPQQARRDRITQFYREHLCHERSQTKLRHQYIVKNEELSEHREHQAQHG